MEDSALCKLCGLRPAHAGYHGICSQCRTAKYCYRLDKTCPECGKRINDKASKCYPCAHKARRTRQSRICEECGATFERPPNQLAHARYCGQACHIVALRRRMTLPGSEHPGWKGGVHMRGDGYIAVHTGRRSRMRLHRIIAQEVLGRPLRRKEVVHHWNLCRTDNRHSNLLICDAFYHQRLHHMISPAWIREHLSPPDSESR